MKLSNRPRNSSSRISKAIREGEVRVIGETVEGATADAVEDAEGEAVEEAAGTEDETNAASYGSSTTATMQHYAKRLTLVMERDTKKAGWSSRHHLIREAAPLAAVGLC